MNAILRICLLYSPRHLCGHRAIYGRKNDKQSFAISVDESRRIENSLTWEDDKKELTPEDENKENTETVPFSKRFGEAYEAIRPGVDYYAKLHKRWDVSLGGIRRWYKHRVYMQSVREQTFVPERHGQLGADISAATFIVQNRGKVRLNNSEWINDVKLLPIDYSPRYKLTAIDATGSGLLYEGFENLIQLKHLRELILCNNLMLDDWCCDIISRINRHSIGFETLDITGCKRITERGVASLVRIHSLKKLIITGTKASECEYLELLIVLFNDLNPKCEIIDTSKRLLE